MIKKLFNLLFKDLYLMCAAYSNNVFPEPLSKEEEDECVKLLERNDVTARNKLIEHNLRLVAHIVKKYEYKRSDIDDLISIGTIGLIKGIDSYSLSKGSRITTYCARCIENEILMHLRSIKKLGAEVYLNEPIGKDKDDNEIALIDILENDEKNIEDEIDLKIKTKKLYSRMKDILKGREQTIIELRFGLRRRKTKNTKSNSKYAWNI